MMWTKFRITFDEQAQNFVDSTPWLLIALAVCIVTCILVYLILVIGERCCTSGKYYTRTRRQMGRAYGRIFMIVLALIILATGFWVAAAMYGLNFFSVLLTYGLVTLIATYTFGTALQCTGAFLFISTTNKICEGDYVVIEGSGVQGRIVFIGILYSTLETNAATGETVDVPQMIFLSSMIRIKRDKVVEAPVNYKVAAWR